MPDISPLLVITLVLVLGAEFVNGWTDAPNAIAIVVSTRVLSPGKAVLMAAVLNLVGAIATGARRRTSAVRWGMVRNIVLTWIITFPACGVLGYLFSLGLKAMGV
jgi:phosphate/sulfate permease